MPAASEIRRQAFLRLVRQIPSGKVATYGQIAKAAGYPRHSRHVARALDDFHGLPWHRVVGSGGRISLQGESAFEQRFRLQTEGVTFRGKNIDMRKHQHKFPAARRRRA